MKVTSILAGALLLCVIASVQSYYVPGTFPREYSKGQAIQVQVNSLVSLETELPFDYYTLPFCKPPEGVKRNTEYTNFGTLLMGQKIENSPYNFSVQVAQYGKTVCPDGFAPPLGKRDVLKLQNKINKQYRVRMILDSLPVVAGAGLPLQGGSDPYIAPGFDVGYADYSGKQPKYYIYNHLSFVVHVHPSHGEYSAATAGFETDNRRSLRKLSKLSMQTDEPLTEESLRKLLEAPKTPSSKLGSTKLDKPDLWMVVGFEVVPCSVHSSVPIPTDGPFGCTGDVQPMEISQGTKIRYTYDVEWVESPNRWTSRWDAYLGTPGGKVHWFSIANSMVVVLVMAVMVAYILVRTVRRDLAKYEQLMIDSNNMDTTDETGWKLVAGDVFRTPYGSESLAVQFGSGVQIIFTSVVTLGLATLGFLSPASRGALLTVLMMLYVLLAFVAGYSAVLAWGIMERTYNGWKSVALKVSLFYPGITMLIFTFLNLLIANTGSTGAVPVGLYFTLVALWFLVSIPLSFVGGYLATRTVILEYPVKTNQVPRHIPPTPTTASPTLLFLVAGVLPFGSLYVELYFGMTSVWMGYFYYLFGFLFLVALLTAIIVCEIAVLTTYVQLCAEDYQWWWQSFYRGGSVTLYVVLYTLTFLLTGLGEFPAFLPFMIYTSYMAIFLLGLYLAMGSIGLAASFCFVRQIFSAVKTN